MAIEWKRLLTLKLDGGRFTVAKKNNSAHKHPNPGLSLHDLEELITLRQALIGVMEYIWLRDNPTEKEFPGNLRREIDVRFFRLDRGSLEIPLEIPVETQPRLLSTQPPNTKSVGPKLPECGRIINDTIQYAIKGKRPPYSLPVNVFDALEPLGKTFAAGEKMFVNIDPAYRHVPVKGYDMPVLDSAPITSTTRKAYADAMHAAIVQTAIRLVTDATPSTDQAQNASLLEEPKPATILSPYPIEAQVIRLDRDKDTFSAVVDVGGKRRQAALSQAQFKQIAAALAEDDKVVLLIRGTFELEALTTVVTRILTVTSIDPISHRESASEQLSIPFGTSDVSSVGEMALRLDNESIRLNELLLINPTVAIIDPSLSDDVVVPRWEGPCEAMFEHLLMTNPGDLIRLIASGTLEYYDLTFAAEIAGRHPDSPVVVQALLPLLSDTHPAVREGAIYGLSLHLDSNVVALLRAMAANDPSPGVRRAAEGVVAGVER